MWVNQIKPSKLGFKLLIKVIAAGSICILIYIILVNATISYVDNMYLDSERYKEQIDITASDLQEYVTGNDISIQDMDAIKTWDRRQNQLHIRLVESNRVIYDSLEYLPRAIIKAASINYTFDKDNIHEVQFFDGSATLFITILYRQRLEQRINYGITAFCILLFCLSILHEFKKLVKDILTIKKGIHILEGGDMSYEIQLKRNDEIADLADSINRMSRIIESKNKWEDTQRVKNYDLVTSISHDIRTPLTSVNSYIDLILDGRFNEQKDIKHYLEKVKEKSNMIMDLTENLFYHFINQNADFHLNFEVVGGEFISYLFRNLEEDLRDRGYQVITNLNIEVEFFLKVDVTQIQRVFNNLEGNLIKYAMKSKPIVYTAVLNNRTLIISGDNYILDSVNMESHGVGMNTCKNIIKLHSGEMNGFIKDNHYMVTLVLPIYVFDTF